MEFLRHAPVRSYRLLLPLKMPKPERRGRKKNEDQCLIAELSRSLPFRWPGPSTCSGGLGDGLPTLTNEPVVRCDEATIRILGLSLAGWNALICAGLAAVGFKGASRKI